MSLTPKQAQFVKEYLIDLSATQAALRAGYSPRTAKKQGSEILKIPHVAEAIASAMAERSERTRVTQDDVLQELTLLGMSNIENYNIDDFGDVKLVGTAPKAAMRAVSSIKKRVRYDEDGNKTVETEIRLWDKPASLRMAGQHLGMFVERVQHGGDPNNPIKTESAVRIYLPDNGRGNALKGDGSA